MLRPACGSLLALFLTQSPALGQMVATCESPQSVEVTVWRGASVSTAAVSEAERMCLEAVDQAEVQIAEPLRPIGWGVPELEVIRRLVLDSPGVSELAPRVLEGSEEPTVGSSGIGRNYLDGMARTGTRAVIITPAVENTPERILHLVIYEASPGRVEVGVESPEGRPFRLSWTRDLDSPEWSLIDRQMLGST